MIELRVTKALADFPLAVDVRLEARAIGLFGASGAGKTSLLHCIAGLARPDSGSIRIDDVVVFDAGARIDLPPEKRRIGYVFQEGRLFPHLSVRDNLLYARRARRLAGDASRFDAIVQLLGIEALLDRRPGTLSGGERQRVAIGRAALSAPRLLLLDEPLASIDVTRRADILRYVHELQAQLGLAMIYVSHDAEELARIAERVLTMERGAAISIGPPDEILPQGHAARALRAFEESSIVAAEVFEHQEHVGLTVLEHPRGFIKVPRVLLPVGTAVRLRVHPRDIVLSRLPPAELSMRNSLRGSVTQLKDVDAAYALVEVEVGRDVLSALITRDAVHELKLSPGEPLFALVKAGAIEVAGTGRFEAH